MTLTTLFRFLSSINPDSQVFSVKALNKDEDEDEDEDDEDDDNYEEEQIASAETGPHPPPIPVMSTPTAGHDTHTAVKNIYITQIHNRSNV